MAKDQHTEVLNAGIMTSILAIAFLWLTITTGYLGFITLVLIPSAMAGLCFYVWHKAIKDENIDNDAKPQDD